MAPPSMAAKALDDEDVGLELVTRSVAVAQVVCNPRRNPSRSVVAYLGSSNMGGCARCVFRVQVRSEKCDKRCKRAEETAYKRVSPRAVKGAGDK